MFVRGLIMNGYQVKAFTFFCIEYCNMVHHHHYVEETYIVPQPQAFMDGLNGLETYFKEAHASTAPYDGVAVIQKISAFADQLVLHLNEEFATLGSSRMRAALTKKDLDDLEALMMSIIMKHISFFTTLPMALFFPPLPKPFIWAIQQIFSRHHKDAWAFAPCNIYGKLKPGLGTA
ncbi:hypothetical protein B0H19DRAFT_1189295 [Mycena capillaripes]|nr:hypothetical protein B0H19DRAFT_1189295 [Mycena capillaripes]